jgi:hypothetical protein
MVSTPPAAIALAVGTASSTLSRTTTGTTIEFASLLITSISIYLLRLIAAEITISEENVPQLGHTYLG